ncbi:hypothetical protein ECANGB1_219 [Enterospora canceri]|uniref:Uncharacterized protein n=1 Tax=Enterospora canceri TaxID=1081671 RepID=A0A1Y1S587_9MICR|nr:hypothetical protein ECANGB1_219 [Enterospora canceri]
MLFVKNEAFELDLDQPTLDEEGQLLRKRRKIEEPLPIRPNKEKLAECIKKMMNSCVNALVGAMLKSEVQDCEYDKVGKV